MSHYHVLVTLHYNSTMPISVCFSCTILSIPTMYFQHVINRLCHFSIVMTPSLIILFPQVDLIPLRQKLIFQVLSLLGNWKFHLTDWTLREASRRPSVGIGTGGIKESVCPCPCTMGALYSWKRVGQFSITAFMGQIIASKSLDLILSWVECEVVQAQVGNHLFIYSPSIL